MGAARKRGTTFQTHAQLLQGNQSVCDSARGCGNLYGGTRPTCTATVHVFGMCPIFLDFGTRSEHVSRRGTRAKPGRLGLRFWGKELEKALIEEDFLLTNLLRLEDANTFECIKVSCSCLALGKIRVNEKGDFRIRLMKQ
jgi:hypothetical protein